MIQVKLSDYQNKKRSIVFQLKKRSKVYLLIRNLKTRRLGKKLNNVKVGLLFIKKSKRLVSYEVDLPKNAKVDLVFYVLLLKLVDLEIPIQNTFNFKLEEEDKFKADENLE